MLKKRVLATLAASFSGCQAADTCSSSLAVEGRYRLAAGAAKMAAYIPVPSTQCMLGVRRVVVGRAPRALAGAAVAGQAVWDSYSSHPAANAVALAALQAAALAVAPTSGPVGRSCRHHWCSQPPLCVKGWAPVGGAPVWREAGPSPK